MLEFKVDGEELEQHDVEERGETGSEEDDVALSPIAISVSSCKILPFNTSISLSRASMKGFLSASSALSSVTSLKRLTLSMLSLAFPPLSRHNCFFFLCGSTSSVSVYQSLYWLESRRFNKFIRGNNLLAQKSSIQAKQRND